MPAVRTFAVTVCLTLAAAAPPSHALARVQGTFWGGPDSTTCTATPVSGGASTLSCTHSASGIATQCVETASVPLGTLPGCTVTFSGTTSGAGAAGGCALAGTARVTVTPVQSAAPMSFDVAVVTAYGFVTVEGPIPGTASGTMWHFEASFVLGASCTSVSGASFAGSYLYL